MKNFDLNALSVEEMTQEEMILVDGGNILADAWNWIKSAARSVADVVKKMAEKYGEELAVAVVPALAIAEFKNLVGLK